MSRPTLKLPTKSGSDTPARTPGRKPIRGSTGKAAKPVAGSRPAPSEFKKSAPHSGDSAPRANDNRRPRSPAAPAAASDRPFRAERNERKPSYERTDRGDRPERSSRGEGSPRPPRPEYLPNGGKPRVRRDDDRRPGGDERPAYAAKPSYSYPPRSTDSNAPSDGPRAVAPRQPRDDRDAPRRPAGDRPSYGYPPRGGDSERGPRSGAPRRVAEGRSDAPRRTDGDRPSYGYPTGNRDARSENRDSRPPRHDEHRGKPRFQAKPAVLPTATDTTTLAAKGPAHDLPRLSKLMSEQGLCSRREADEWIENGWVKVDGEVVDTLGVRVSPKARIEIAPAAAKHQSESVTILLHKPIGYVSGQAEDGYEPASVLILPENRWEEDNTGRPLKQGHLRGLAPAGRLDIDSTGMLVLTQDGRVARRLVGDDAKVEKEYLVRVEGTLIEDGMKLLNHGLSLDGVKLKPANVSWQNEEQLRFVLREGKKRQIRRMCEMVGLKVVGLKRIRIGSVVLGKLPVGQWRFLRHDEKF